MALLLYLFVLGAPLALSEPTSSGQQFVQQLKNFFQAGATRGDLETTLQLTNSTISLASVPYPDGWPLKPSGLSLTVDGSEAPSGYSVLDLAMRSNLTRAFDSPTPALTWSNLVLINLCTYPLVWNPFKNWWILSASQMWLMPRSRTTRTTTRTNTTMYMPYHEVMALVYWQVIYRSPFQDVQSAVTQVILQLAPPANTRITRMTMYSITFAVFELAGGVDYNVTAAATNNPASPAAFRLKELGGGHMDHRFCAGPEATGALLSPAQALQPNTTLFPMWMADSTQSLSEAMLRVSQISLSRAPTDPYPCIALVANISLVTATTISVRSPFMLQGPFNDVPGAAVAVELDMSHKPALVSMAKGATLYISKLTLTGLAHGPLPTEPSYFSSLPLWAVNAYTGVVPQVQLDNVTLVLEGDDFAALLAAVLRGSAWQRANRTAPLLAGITVLEPAPSAPPSRTRLTLATYVGWGINATNLVLLPEQALGPDYVLPDLLLDSGSGSSVDSRALGLGVGLGGAALLLAALGGLLLLRRQRHNRQVRYRAGKAEEDDKRAAAQRLTADHESTAASRLLIHKAVAQAAEALTCSPLPSPGRQPLTSDAYCTAAKSAEAPAGSHSGSDLEAGPPPLLMKPPHLLPNSNSALGMQGSLVGSGRSNGVHKEQGAREGCGGSGEEGEPQLRGAASSLALTSSPLLSASSLATQTAGGSSPGLALGPHPPSDTGGRQEGVHSPRGRGKAGGSAVSAATSSAQTSDTGPGPSPSPGTSGVLAAAPGGRSGTSGTSGASDAAGALPGAGGSSCLAPAAAKTTLAGSAGSGAAGSGAGGAEAGAAGATSNGGARGAAGPPPPLDPVKAMQHKVGLGKMDADKLTLISVLGRGAWGTVYRGTWRGLTVAVKTVLFSEREDGDTKLPHERAIMEAAVCTSVAHRNVVSTYHYDIKPVRAVESSGDEGLQVEVADSASALGITDWKLPGVVQQHAGSGAALLLLHKKETRVPLVDLLLGLLLDVAAGMLYLHERNIIHGDLKPENIMLRTDASAQIGVVAKITDFGLSTTLAPHMTHVSNFKSGTPYYCAPEVTALGRTTKASDAYSMGVLMWEAYCCTPPWIKVGNEYLANSRFPSFPPHAPRPLVQLVNRCLSAQVRQRPTFDTILAQLQAMLYAWQCGYDSLELPGAGPGAAQHPPPGLAPSPSPPAAPTGPTGPPAPLLVTAAAAGPQAPAPLCTPAAESITGGSSPPPAPMPPAPPAAPGAGAGGRPGAVSPPPHSPEAVQVLSQWVSQAQPAAL
ncbi:hypothetical protein V8C86DRAFT_2896405 [Haematococcus lacustris]